MLSFFHGQGSPWLGCILAVLLGYPPEMYKHRPSSSLYISLSSAFIVNWMADNFWLTYGMFLEFPLWNVILVTLCHCFSVATFLLFLPWYVLLCFMQKLFSGPRQRYVVFQYHPAGSSTKCMDLKRMCGGKWWIITQFNNASFDRWNILDRHMP